MNDPEQLLFAEAFLVSGDSKAALATFPLLLEDDEAAGRGLRMQLPLNPEDIHGDFEYELVMVAGTQRCNAGTVYVTGLTPSLTPDTTLEALEFVLEDLLIEYGASFGLTTWDQLEAAVEDYGADSEPRVRLASLLMAVEAKQGLRRQLEDLTAEQREIVAAIVEQLDLVEILRVRAESVVTGLSTFVSSGDGVGKLVMRPTQIQWDDSQLVPLSGGACQQLTGDRVDITTAAELDKYMRAQADAAASLDSNWRPVLAALTPLVRGGAGNVAGITLFVESMVKGFDTYQLPNQFTGLVFELSPGQRIPEDTERDVHWGDALVGALSDEWILDETLIDALGTGFSSGKWLGSLGAPAQSAASELFSNYVESTVLATLKNQVGGANCFVVPAHSWSPIDVTDEAYTKPEVFGDSIELERQTTVGPSGVTTQETKINLIDIGISELRVRVRNDGGQFGGKSVSKLLPIEILPIKLDFTPFTYRAETQGDVVVMELRITDSEKADTVVPVIEFSTPDASLLFTPEVVERGENSAVYKVEVLTPGEAEEYPVLVEASRVSPLPPRDKRIGRGEIVLEETITLTPSRACVLPGASLDLSAELDGFAPNTSVDWSVESPALLSNFQVSGDLRTARFSSAQNGSFLVQVTAPSVIKPGTEIIDTAVISVGSCEKVHLWGLHRAVAEAGSGIGGEERYDSEDPALLQKAPFPPAQHDLFWSSRTEQLVKSLLAMGELNGVEVRAGLLTEGTLAADADGVVTIRHTVDNATGECVAPQPTCDPNVTKCEIRCTDVFSDFAGAAVFYIDVDAPKTYRLEMEGSCALTGEAAGGLAVMAYVTRLPAGSTDEDDHELPNRLESVNAFSPNLTEMGGMFLVQNVCGSAVGGVWSESIMFTLDGPFEPNTTDLVTVTVGVGSTMVLNYSTVDLTEQSLFPPSFQPNQSGGIGFIPFNTVAPPSLYVEFSGTGGARGYFGSMATEMSVQLQQID